ncbi:O-methyltransferase [Clostridium sediminicola]|uniref:O-methyltransferase n=1 Tax=Clostridium sediminicola TaxID=3114879 RepID=UPI0031F21B87
MDGVALNFITEYLNTLIEEKDSNLLKLEEYANVNNVPIVQREVANLLKFMVAMKKPKRILELGTAIGYSSILMNNASESVEDIVTIERNENMVKIAQKNIQDAQLDKKIQIIEGDCLEILKTLNEKFDMIFIDAGKGHYNEFFPYCLDLLNKEGVIISDNVLFRGMVANNDLVIRRKITIVKRMRKYLMDISKREDLVTTVLPIGDGVAITIRRN